MTDKKELYKSKEYLLDMIYDRGSVKFGAFKLKLHEEDPEAPLSPIYINLRKSPDGPLKDEDIEAIGQEIYKFVKDKEIDFDLVVGIPKAGDPIAKVVAQLSGKPLLKLNKKTEGDKRRIDSIANGGDYQKGQRVLIVDDLITQADTKKEAIDICEQSGLTVSAVTVLLDREQGGAKDLQNAYNLLAVFLLTDLLQQYILTEKISQTKGYEVMAYIANKENTF